MPGSNNPGSFYAPTFWAKLAQATLCNFWANFVILGQSRFFVQRHNACNATFCAEIRVAQKVGLNRDFLCKACKAVQGHLLAMVTAVHTLLNLHTLAG